ncbi:hypothetical protein D3C76_183380 [compost metagenome]
MDGYNVIMQIIPASPAILAELTVWRPRFKLGLQLQSWTGISCIRPASLIVLYL